VDPPYHHPVFVLTHLTANHGGIRGTTFAFVTDGIVSALDQARTSAAGRNVSLAGGAQVARQLAADLVEEMAINLEPIFRGWGNGSSTP